MILGPTAWILLVGSMMYPDLVPWKMLSATVGVGVLTPGWNLSTPPAEGEEEEGRSFVTEVSFSAPFDAPPVVHLGLTGFDVEEQTSARITLAAESVTPEGFEVRISTWRESLVYAVEFNWLAVGA